MYVFLICIDNRPLRMNILVCIISKDVCLFSKEKILRITLYFKNPHAVKKFKHLYLYHYEHLRKKGSNQLTYTGR